MRLTAIALLGVSAILMDGCTANAPAEKTVDTGEIANEVKAAIHTQVAAYAARDPVKAASIVAPDLVTMFHGEANGVGKQANMEAMKAQMADPAVSLAVSDETVDVAAAGDMAIYHATYRFTFTHPETSKPATEIGNWVAVFKRQPDGTMKMSQDMILDIPPPKTNGS